MKRNDLGALLFCAAVLIAFELAGLAWVAFWIAAAWR